MSPAAGTRSTLSDEKVYLLREKLDHAFTITDPAKVARIAAIINGFNPDPPLD